MIKATAKLKPKYRARIGEIVKGKHLSRQELEEELEPELKPEYIKKINRIRKQKFIKIDDFKKRYGIK